ncbi:hypothetical protein EJB05_41646, partial [Eragrostis curvula]
MHEGNVPHIDQADTSHAEKASDDSAETRSGRGGEKRDWRDSSDSRIDKFKLREQRGLVRRDAIFGGRFFHLPASPASAPASAASSSPLFAGEGGRREEGLAVAVAAGRFPSGHMAKRPTVPKFGTWDSDNVGYTVYFDKVRENKGATAPPLNRPFNPNDPEDGPMRAVPQPSSRPATSGGRPNGGQAHHRRAGSSSSEPGGRGAEQSKFAPPPQYNPRPSPQNPQQQQQQQHHGGGHRHQAPPAGYGGAGAGAGGGHRGQQAPRQPHHHHQAAPAPRARSASPQNNVPNRQRPSAAVPKFGVWDEQSAASAAQGFTVQFDRVKREKQVARSGVPDVPRPPPPPEPRHSHRDSPFFAKMFGCFRPTDRH